MRLFFVALQFLTRIHIVRQDSWTAEDFGRSTRFFPLVGIVLGLIYMLAAAILFNFVPVHVAASLMLIITIAATGGLHYDGFMDTMDGLLSARSRERMLEIMKDSRVGSYGALSAMCLLLLQWSFLRELEDTVLYMALFLMPVIGRMAMVMVIAVFPYARPQGLGKAFADMADKKTVIIAGTITIMAILPWEPVFMAIASLLAGLGFAWLFGRYGTRRLGGLTGDLYGAIELMTETVVLGTFCLSGTWAFLLKTILDILSYNFCH